MSPWCCQNKGGGRAFACSHISMIADSSHRHRLFPLSKRRCAVDPMLRQICSKHSDRCIHKRGSQGPRDCSNTALNYLSTEQLSRLPFVYPPCRRVGEVEQRRLPGTKWDEMELTRGGSGPKHSVWVWQWMSKNLIKGVQKQSGAVFHRTEPLDWGYILNMLS